MTTPPRSTRLWNPFTQTHVGTPLAAPPDPSQPYAACLGEPPSMNPHEWDVHNWPTAGEVVSMFTAEQALSIVGTHVAWKRLNAAMNELAYVFVSEPDWDTETTDRAFRVVRQHSNLDLCPRCNRVKYTSHYVCPLCSTHER